MYQLTNFFPNFFWSERWSFARKFSFILVNFSSICWIFFDVYLTERDIFSNFLRKRWKFFWSVLNCTTIRLGKQKGLAGEVAWSVWRDSRPATDKVVPPSTKTRQWTLGSFLCDGLGTLFGKQWFLIVQSPNITPARLHLLPVWSLRLGKILQALHIGQRCERLRAPLVIPRQPSPVHTTRCKQMRISYNMYIPKHGWKARKHEAESTRQIESWKCTWGYMLTSTEDELTAKTSHSAARDHVGLSQLQATRATQKRWRRPWSPRTRKKRSSCSRNSPTTKTQTLAPPPPPPPQPWSHGCLAGSKKHPFSTMMPLDFPALYLKASLHPTMR